MANTLFHDGSLQSISSVVTCFITNAILLFLEQLLDAIKSKCPHSVPDNNIVTAPRKSPLQSIFQALLFTNLAITAKYIASNSKEPQRLKTVMIAG